MAVTGLPEVLVKVWLMEACPVACAEPPEKPEPVGAVHVYLVPAGTIVAAVGTPFTGVTVNAVPLQMVVVWFGISGVGFNATTVVATTPGQLYQSFTERVYVPPPVEGIFGIDGLAALEVNPLGPVHE